MERLSAEELLQMTLGQMLARAAAAHPDREAVVWANHPDRPALTYRQLDQQATRLARGLAGLGYRRGDVLGIWLVNRPEWVVTYFAAARLGVWLLALNTRYRHKDLDYILRHSGARGLVTSPGFQGNDYLAIVRELAPAALGGGNLPNLQHLILVDGGAAGTRAQQGAGAPAADALPGAPGVLAYDDLLQSGSAGAGLPGEVGPDDVALLLYTSGTTSFPKGAMLAHRNILPHGYLTGVDLGFTPDERVLMAVPLCGAWGCTSTMLSIIPHGAALILADRFEPGEALAVMERERVTVAPMVDAMVAALLDHPDRPRRDLSALRMVEIALVTGGGPALMDRIYHELGARDTAQFYGLTEVNPAVARGNPRDPWEIRRAALGPVPAWVEGRVADPTTDRPLPPGQPGEMQFRGISVMKGYFHDPEATGRATTRDGWFKTGDECVLDEAGYVYFKGRLKDMLKTSGFNVSPVEIEDFLRLHPQVAEAFVVGIPDPRLGEAVCAFVIPRPGTAPTPEQIQAFCRGQIASFKVPRLVLVVEDVPRTQSPHGDKVQKHRLRELAVAAAQGREAP